MIYLATASKDTTAYSLYPTINSGIDEILDISKAYTINGDEDIARTFIKFDIDNLPLYITASFVELQLQITKIESVPLSYTIYGYPIIEDWEMGVGRKADTIQTASGSLSWNYQPNIYTNLSASQKFEFEDGDIHMDITSIYNYWTGSNNYGIRLAHSESVESSSLDYGYISFYSKETNTYRQPLLKIGFDDQEYITGSLKSISENKDIIIKSKGLKQKYPIGKLVKFNFVTRDKFPTKKFSSIFAYEAMQYIPQDSYYAIKDVVTGLNILNFSDYTKISCNVSGSYIKLDTTNFPTNRPLKFQFMINRDGVFEKYEDDLTFEVG